MGFKWLDAADDTEVNISDIKCSKDYLVERECFGKLVLEDEYGYVFITDKDENGNCEITAIPKGWKIKNEKKLVPVKSNVGSDSDVARLRRELSGR